MVRSHSGDVMGILKGAVMGMNWASSPSPGPGIVILVLFP